MFRMIILITLLFTTNVIVGQDVLNFSLIGELSLKQTKKTISEYDRIITEAEKTGKVIVVTKGVINVQELEDFYKSLGYLFLNGDNVGKDWFPNGVSKIRAENGNVRFIEVPSSFFLDKPQGTRYNIVWNLDGTYNTTPINSGAIQQNNFTPMYMRSYQYATPVYNQGFFGQNCGPLG